VPAHRQPLPPLFSRRGLGERVARLLRGIGVELEYLYKRLDWVPEMTILALPEDQTRAVLEGAGAKIVHVTRADVDSGGTESRIFYVSR
jgi:hypothetical protein